MRITNANSIKIGDRIRIRKSIFTIVGTDKHGFVAEQEYKGTVHTVTIPLSSFGNPHLMAIEPA
jgi:hypothetical protein